MLLDLLIQPETQAGLRAFLPALICVAIASLLGLSVSIGLAWRIRAIGDATPRAEQRDASEAANRDSAADDA